MAMKVAPAMATGNCLIVKSSEKAPLTSLLFATLVQKTGKFPPGVLQILSGLGPNCGAALAEHMEIRKLAFTGSGRTGRIIKAASARSNLKNVTLELGGKSPLIVFPDANLDRAAAMAAFSITANAGQLCMASSRLYVHADIAEKFIDKFRHEFTALTNKWGDPLDPSITHGPQADRLQYEHVTQLLGSAKTAGLTPAIGGARLGNKGYFVEPTIFYGVSIASMC